MQEAYYMYYSWEGSIGSKYEWRHEEIYNYDTAASVTCAYNMTLYNMYNTWILWHVTYKGLRKTKRFNYLFNTLHLLNLCD